MSIHKKDPYLEGIDNKTEEIENSKSCTCDLRSISDDYNFGCPIHDSSNLLKDLNLSKEQKNSKSQDSHNKLKEKLNEHIKSLSTIKTYVEEINSEIDKEIQLHINTNPFYHSKDLIIAKDKYDEHLEDALTGITTAYKERISYIEGNKESLLVSCDSIRGSIRDLCYALVKLGCKREAENIASHIEDGCEP